MYKKTSDGFCVDQGPFYHFLTRVPNPSLRVEQTLLIYTLCTVHLYTALDSHTAFLPFFPFFFVFRVSFCTTLLSPFLHLFIVSGDHGSESFFSLIHESPPVYTRG